MPASTDLPNPLRSVDASLTLSGRSPSAVRVSTTWSRRSGFGLKLRTGEGPLWLSDDQRIPASIHIFHVTEDSARLTVPE